MTRQQHRSPMYLNYIYLICFRTILFISNYYSRGFETVIISILGADFNLWRLLSNPEVPKMNAEYARTSQCQKVISEKLVSIGSQPSHPNPVLVRFLRFYHRYVAAACLAAECDLQQILKYVILLDSRKLFSWCLLMYIFLLNFYVLIIISLNTFLYSNIFDTTSNNIYT